MAKSINVDEKKRGRGRPRTGMQPVLSGRVPKEIVAAIDEWAAANGYTRSEGVAVLLTRGLEAVRVDAVVAANRVAKLKKR
jgi:hypothetical protein